MNRYKWNVLLSGIFTGGLSFKEKDKDKVTPHKTLLYDIISEAEGQNDVMHRKYNYHKWSTSWNIIGGKFKSSVSA